MERDAEKLLDALASGAPTPGGGGTAALCGALAIALGNMVGNLTLGKKKYADVQADIAGLNARAEALELIGGYAAKGSALAISDAGCAAALAEAAAKSAALNVFINTRAMSGREAADRLNIEANSLMTHCCLVAGEIYDEVYGRLADG